MRENKEIVYILKDKSEEKEIFVKIGAVLGYF